jgi:hypothetical protein
MPLYGQRQKKSRRAYMAAQPGAGRPTKYTEQTVSKLLEALKGGNTRRASCAAAGIDQTTLANWLKEYSDFSYAVEKAEGEAELRNLAVIQDATRTTWQAAAWWLERKHKQEWSSRVEQTGADGSPVKVIVEYADGKN